VADNLEAHRVTQHQLALLSNISGTGSGVEFIELQAASIRVPPPPRFFFGDFLHLLSDHYFSMTHLHPMGVFVCNDMAVTAPYLITREGLVFACPQSNFHESHIQQLIKKQGTTSVKNQKWITGDCAMIFGPGHKIFGHWMIDLLPKIFLLNIAGYNIAKISFLVPSDTPPFAIELMRLAGIKSDQVVQFDVDTETVHCQRLLLPTTCHNGVRFADLFQEGVAWLRDRIESHFGPLAVAPASQQIFVSRAHAHAGNRVLVNRAEIEAMAVAQGFSFVYPEEITLLQQFSVFAGARRIVGEYGSALHTAMFSQPGTLICALRGDGIHPGFAQSGIATALGHDIGYVIGTNVAESWDFRIEPSHFAAAMRCISGGAPLAR
jgi:capsular polysaccharide biosynthesis protein